MLSCYPIVPAYVPWPSGEGLPRSVAYARKLCTTPTPQPPMPCAPPTTSSHERAAAEDTRLPRVTKKPKHPMNCIRTSPHIPLSSALHFSPPPFTCLLLHRPRPLLHLDIDIDCSDLSVPVCAPYHHRAFARHDFGVTARAQAP
ncbi:hypothetical protein VTO73DRAFT_5769 [Trametes versicolor]